MSTTEEKIETSTKWELLGATRFILASIVLAGHISQFVTVNHGWTKWGLWLNQGSAVFGFLVISGYSIAASLEQSRDRFYLRRARRILPIYLLSIMLALAAALIVGGNATYPNGDTISMPTVLQTVATLFMLQTIIAPTISTDGPLWTLAVEWWHYMFAPLLQKLSSPWIIAIAGASLTYNVIIRPPDASHLLYGRSLICLSWYWLAGFLYYRHRRTHCGYIIIFFPVLIAYSSGTFVGRAVIIGLMAIALCDEIKVPTKLSSLMNWLGEISYPLYTLQGPIMILAVFWGIHSSIVIFAATVAISALAHTIFEVPVRAWLTRRLRTPARNQTIVTTSELDIQESSAG
jgi:peptidoglycan/LPS O-acetylase OafA/YrhL